MKNTYTVTQAQSKLPGLVREVNEGATAYGISVHDTVKAYLVSRDRMEAIMETLEVLSNPDALQAVREYKDGKTRLHTLEDLEK